MKNNHIQLIQLVGEKGNKDVLINKKFKIILSIFGFLFVTAFVFVVEMLASQDFDNINTVKFFNNLKIALLMGSIYAVIALSMNLTNGFTGIFSLGQAGFMLLGAYIFAIFTIPPDLKDIVYLNGVNPIVRNLQLPIPLAYLVSGLVCSGVAYLLGLVVLRFKSDYLAIATIGFIEIVRAVINALPTVTNGTNPLSSIPTFNSVAEKIIGDVGYGGTTLAFLICAICIFLMTLVIKSSYGKAFMSIREDDVAAEAVGINLARTKRLSFAISAFFAGIGGALFAMAQGGSINTSTSSFGLDLIYFILLMVVIGGLGSISGSILAGYLVFSLREWWLVKCNDEIFIGSFKVPLFGTGFKMLVFSIIILLIVLIFRKGIMGNKEFSWEGFFRFFINFKSNINKFLKAIWRFIKNIPGNVKKLLNRIIHALKRFFKTNPTEKEDN